MSISLVSNSSESLETLVLLFYFLPSSLMSTFTNTTTASPTATYWKAERDHRGEWYIVSNHGQYLAAMTIGWEHLDARHARLMATAPRLLGALQDLLVVTELNLDEIEPATIVAIARARQIIGDINKQGDGDYPRNTSPQTDSSSECFGLASRLTSLSPSPPNHETLPRHIR